MIRGATLVLCYLIVLVTTVRVIPVTGALLYENSGVGADTPLSVQITFWLIPFCFVVLLMLIAEITAFRALWALGSRCTARLRSTTLTRPLGHLGRLDSGQRTRLQGERLPMINQPDGNQPKGNRPNGNRRKVNRSRSGSSRNDARRTR